MGCAFPLSVMSCRPCSDTSTRRWRSPTVSSKVVTTDSGQSDSLRKSRTPGASSLSYDQADDHQPARQNVIKTSTSVLQRGSLQWAEEVEGRGWGGQRDATFHIKEHVSHPLDATSSNRYNSFFSPIWWFGTSCLPESTSSVLHCLGFSRPQPLHCFRLIFRKIFWINEPFTLSF